MTSNGSGVATLLPICVDLYVAPGTTQSFYVTHSDTNIVAYTNGTTTGSVYASNADLEFYEGSGHAYPFQANFNPRVWNGNIFYNVGNTSGRWPHLRGDLVLRRWLWRLGLRLVLRALRLGDHGPRRLDHHRPQHRRWLPRPGRAWRWRRSPLGAERHRARAR